MLQKGTIIEDIDTLLLRGNGKIIKLRIREKIIMNHRILMKINQLKLELYQIFITHNRIWSIREIIYFSILFIIVLIVSLVLYYKKKIVRKQVISALLIVIYLSIVFASTVFTRIPSGIHQYEWRPFWSWVEVYHGSQELLIENLLNILLLVPLGVLLPILFHKRLSWKKGLLAGIFVSAMIETCQLISCRGLFEWDDIIHNGIGCMIGCVISGMIVSWKNKE